ncbi:hypothetical protein [Actinomyces sp. S4-C9]|uniref:hypothetical protein n=1 Tax=Actinomyces sp. S4-C9 TaxID=1219581 RepID=UPI001E2D7D42|nr:hypothetical protein [Actinomyces sp. S4-C9]
MILAILRIPWLLSLLIAVVLGAIGAYAVGAVFSVEIFAAPIIRAVMKKPLYKSADVSKSPSSLAMKQRLIGLLRRPTGRVIPTIPANSANQTRRRATNHVGMVIPTVTALQSQAAIEAQTMAGEGKIIRKIGATTG